MSEVKRLTMCDDYAELENRICRQIQDLHSSFGIKERRSFTKLHIPVHSFYLKGLKLSFFFHLRAMNLTLLHVRGFTELQPIKYHGALNDICHDCRSVPIPGV